MIRIKNLTNGRLDFTLKDNKTISVNAYSSIVIKEEQVTDTIKNAVGIGDIKLIKDVTTNSVDVNAKKKNGGEK